MLNKLMTDEEPYTPAVHAAVYFADLQAKIDDLDVICQAIMALEQITQRLTRRMTRDDQEDLIPYTMWDQQNVSRILGKAVLASRGAIHRSLDNLFANCPDLAAGKAALHRLSHHDPMEPT